MSRKVAREADSKAVRESITRLLPGGPHGAQSVRRLGAGARCCLLHSGWWMQCLRWCGADYDVPMRPGKLFDRGSSRALVSRNGSNQDLVRVQALAQKLGNGVNKPTPLKRQRSMFGKFQESRALYPGPIDNTPLLLAMDDADAMEGASGAASGSGPGSGPGSGVGNSSLLQLRQHLREGEDGNFVVVPESVWAYLADTFGGGPRLVRFLLPPARAAGALSAQLSGASPAAATTATTATASLLDLVVEIQPIVVHCAMADGSGKLLRDTGSGGDSGSVHRKLLVSRCEPTDALLRRVNDLFGLQQEESAAKRSSAKEASGAEKDKKDRKSKEKEMEKGKGAGAGAGDTQKVGTRIHLRPWGWDVEDQDEVAVGSIAAGWVPVIPAEGEVVGDMVEAPEVELMCVDAEAWREVLKVGSAVDGMDTEKRWYEAQIMQVVSASSHDVDDQLLVHYKGWSKKWDRWLARRSPCIQPPHTNVRHWRRFKIGQMVELRRDFTPSRAALTDKNTGAAAKAGKAEVSKWFRGEVVDVDYERIVDEDEDDDEDQDQDDVKSRVYDDDTPSSPEQDNRDAQLSAPPASRARIKAKAKAKAKAKQEEKAKAKAKARERMRKRAVEKARARERAEDADDKMEGLVCKRVKVTLIGMGSPKITEWVDAQSERICDADTHIMSKTKTLNNIGLRQALRASQGVRGAPIAHGAVGMANIGNTCFMNSVLQCLASAEDLTRFFIEPAGGNTSKWAICKAMRDQVNAYNPLGTGGNLALAYAALLRDMWSGGYKEIAPHELKRIVAQKAPQFAGQLQHDSQEFLAFLTDGLHEDLNRVKKKPTTAGVESRGRDDAIVAQESWRNFSLRNQSAVVDRFFGQLKSNIACKQCGFASVTFDPFSALSVPLPSQNQRHIVITFVPRNGAQRYRFSCSVLRTGNVAGLKQRVCKAVKNARAKAKPRSKDGSTEDVRPGTLVIALVVGQRIFRLIGDSTPVFELRSSDLIFAYEVLEQDSRAAPIMEGEAGDSELAKVGQAPTERKIVLVELLMRIHHHPPTATSATFAPARHFRDTSLFGRSLLLSLNDNITCAELHAEVWQQTQHLVRQSRYSADRPPYRLFVTNSAGTDDGVEVGRHSDVPLVSILNIEGDDATLAEVATPLTSVRRMDSEDQEEEESGKRGVADKCARVALTMEWAQANFQRGYASGPAELVLTGEHTGGEDDEDEDDDRISLNECLNQFTSSEQMSGNDMWYCPKCRKHRPAMKKMEIWHAPSVLMVQLKRFRYIQGKAFVHREKIDALVEFPTRGLDLSPYVRGPQSGDGSTLLYDLFAVSEHSGSLSGGHYTAATRNFVNKQWYAFNDRIVSPISVDNVVSPRAYVLFYKKRQGHRPGRSDSIASNASSSASFSLANERRKSLI